MSPRPRVAKYGATHSCHTSGVANYLASRHRASVAAPAPRQTIRHVRRNHPHPHAPRNNRRYSLCDASIAIATTLLTCTTRYLRSCAGIGNRIEKCVPTVRPSFHRCATTAIPSPANYLASRHRLRCVITAPPTLPGTGDFSKIIDFSSFFC